MQRRVLTITASRTAWVAAGVVFVAATIWLTSSALELLPAASDRAGPAEEVGFLAHLLFPLSAALFLIVIVTVLGAGYRVLLAFRRPTQPEESSDDAGLS